MLEKIKSGVNENLRMQEVFGTYYVKYDIFCCININQENVKVS